MAKTWVVDLGFFDFPEIRKLSTSEAFLFACLVFNPAATKPGIFPFYATDFAAKKGRDKFLLSEDFKIIDSDLQIREILPDKLELERECALEARAGMRVKELIFSLQVKGLIEYDNINHVIYIPSYHRYIPFNSGKAIIVASEICLAFNLVPTTHPFWKKYWAQYGIEVQLFFSSAEEASKKSKKDKNLLTSKEYRQIKGEVFKDIISS